MNPETMRGLSTEGRILLAVVAVVMTVVVVSMLRRRRLHEEYALVWLALIVGMVVVMASEWLLWRVTALVGAKYPASVLTLISLAVVFFFLILYSTRISVLSDKVRDLTQELALVRAELAQGGGETSEPEAGDGR